MQNRGRRFRAGRWGELYVAPMRYGVLQFRLVVLAPGATEQDYRLLRLADWAVWCAAVAFVACLALLLPPVGPAGGETAGMVVAAIVAAATGLLVHRSARRVRRNARVVAVCIVPNESSAVVRASAAAAQEALTILRTADALRREGLIDAVEHELAWARAWGMLPPRRSGRPVGRSVLADGS